MPGALDYLKQRLAELDEQGLLLQPRTLEGPTGARARFDGRDVINLASNNYLGLANHPRMNAAAAKAASELGAGTGAVRTIAGSMTLHRELERRFAELQARGGRADVPVGLHGERRDRRRDPRQAGRDRERPPEPRVDHRRREALARRDQGVRAQGRRPRGRAPAGEQGGGPAAAAGDGRRVLDGRGHRAAPGARRGRRATWGDHDDRRRARVGRPRHGRRGDRRPLRPARPGRRPGRDALEGDRRPGRVHRGAPRADRVAAEPRPAPPVLDERAAGGGRRVHRGARHHRRRARAARPALVEHRVVQGRAARARVRYRCERDPDHAGDHRGRGADAGVRAAAVRGGRVLPGDRVPHRGARAPRACGRSSPRTTRRRTWARRSRRSGGSAPSSVCARDPGSGSGRVRARRGSTGPGRSRTRRRGRTRPSEDGSRGAPRTRRAARSRPPCDGRDVPR